MSKSTKMNPGGGVYTNNPYTKYIPFTIGSGIGAVSQSNLKAINRSVTTRDCIMKLKK
jgi:hypothetical protein